MTVKEPPGNSNIDWIWGMRGMAIISVVLYHWFNFFPIDWLTTAVRAGAQGAYTFFILSAFGLYLSLAKGNRRIGSSWFLKRFLKVLVPYYMAVAVVCAAIFLYAWLKAGIPLGLKHFDLNLHSFLATVLLYRGFFDQYVFVINPSWWFAVTILELYLVFPLLCAFYRRVNPLVFLTVLLFVNLAYQYITAIVLNTHPAVFAKLFPSFLFEFSLGIYLADLYVRDHKTFMRLTAGLIPFLAGLILRGCGLWLALQGREGYAFSNSFTAIGFSLIAYNIYLILLPRLKSIFNWIGRCSFGLFLLHEPFIALLHNVLGPGPFSSAVTAWLLAVYFCLMAAVSCLFHHWCIDRNPFAPANSTQK